MSAFQFVLVIIFLGVVVPTWMHYHYGRDRRRGAATIANPVDTDELNALRDTATRLEERVRTLERVLDAEAPDWRSKI